MAELNPVFLDSLTYPAKELRKILGDIYTEGILTSGALAVSQSGTPAMSVSVALGRAIITNDEGNFGKYVIENDAAVTKTIAASDPSNPRIDRIIAQVYDATDISGASDDWHLEVLTGTPAASPSAPALPSNAISLATVAVAAGVITIVNANITDTRARSSSIIGKISGDGVATGAEVTTGTDNTKIVTPKAIGDALVNTRLKSKLIIATRNIASIGGDISYTGVNFTPTSITCIACVTTTLIGSYGVTDSSKTSMVQYTTHTGVIKPDTGNSRLVFLQSGVSDLAYAVVKSFDSPDGFTLTWTNGGSPTGTATLIFLCTR